jgi:hypothetical protein
VGATVKGAWNDAAIIVLLTLGLLLMSWDLLISLRVALKAPAPSSARAWATLPYVISCTQPEPLGGRSAGLGRVPAGIISWWIFGQ